MWAEHPASGTACRCLQSCCAPSAPERFGGSERRSAHALLGEPSGFLVASQDASRARMCFAFRTSERNTSTRCSSPSRPTVALTPCRRRRARSAAAPASSRCRDTGSRSPNRAAGCVGPGVPCVAAPRSCGFPAVPTCCFLEEDVHEASSTMAPSARSTRSGTRTGGTAATTKARFTPQSYPRNLPPPPVALDGVHRSVPGSPGSCGEAPGSCVGVKPLPWGRTQGVER